jgi:hypothetical protein
MDSIIPSIPLVWVKIRTLCPSLCHNGRTFDEEGDEEGEGDEGDEIESQTHKQATTYL